MDKYGNKAMQKEASSFFLENQKREYDKISIKFARWKRPEESGWKAEKKDG
jgi:hypothetical protein